MGGRIKVRSGLNPMLWLCAIITTPCLILYGIKTNASDWLLVFAIAPEAAAILGFFFLLIFDRPYLQSEQFQIRKMELEIIEEKGKPPKLVTDEDFLIKTDAVSLLPEQGTDE